MRVKRVDNYMEDKFGKPQWDKTFINSETGQYLTPIGDNIRLFRVNNNLRDDFTLYSESQGRIVVTVAPQDVQSFENMMFGNYARIGTIRDDERFVVKGSSGKEVASTTITSLSQSYKSTFGGF